jgi:hypothetical protein
MAEALATYTTRVSGLRGARHELRQADQALGVLTLRRNPVGLVQGAEYRPLKGEVFVWRRDPGLLRSQFSMWTDKREWMASSLRWSWFRREIEIDAGGKPFRLAPSPVFRRGWIMYAPKTGETLRVQPGAFSRHATIEVLRKLDFHLLLFAYFLASLADTESLFPGPRPAAMAAD